MVAGILILIWVICVAMLWNEGMWNNCITLINVLLAALLSMNFWEPLSDAVEKRMGSYTYVIDFLSMWFIFFLSYILLRMATDLLSQTRVKFKMPIEQTGRIVSPIVIGWIMVCFTLATMHTAPLARTAVRGSFQAEPMSNNFLGLAPDRMWLGYVQHRSKNALSNSPLVVFDANGEYIFKYGARRERFSKEQTVRVNR